MFEIFFKAWFLVAIMPFIMVTEGYTMFKNLMNRKNWWGKLPYALLVILILLLLILLAKGYRW